MARFSVVVPVRNEAKALRETLPSLLKAMEGLHARVVWVCNDCTDDSFQVIRHLVGRNAELLELPRPGKTAALQAGDDTLGNLFPRFYLDADVTLSPGAMPELLRPLLDGRADLVAARRLHNTDGVSAVSAAMARTWDALPHGREAGFLGAIGVSEAGRDAWGRWPNLVADDSFLAASIRPERRIMLPHVTAITRPPANFVGWVRMRARWRRGHVELRELGMAPPKATGQRSALMRQILTPAQAPGAIAFVAARLLSSFVREGQAADWVPDRRGWS